MELDGILRRLNTAKTVVVDVETSGLSWQKDRTVGYVITFGAGPEDSRYLPVGHQGGNLPDPELLERQIIAGLDRDGLRVIGHNLSFDLKFLYRKGLRFAARYEDTMINAALINEHQESMSLDYCTRIAGVEAQKLNLTNYLIEQFPALKATPKQAMGHFWQLAGDDPKAVEYACVDGTATWQLWEWQQKELEQQELRRVHDIECRLIPVLARMTCRGVRIDQERLGEVKQILNGKREEALRVLPDSFNSRSPIQVRKLMEQHGHTDWPLTPKGAPSFPEAWMVKNPVGQQIITVRKISNLLNSFIEPMEERHLWNGRCHPEYNQLRGDEYGTVTGRLSSSNPNLQQVNKRNKELGRLHRSIFVPDPGMRWGSVDYSQCEPRLLAYYSRSKVLLDGYRSKPPLDAHAAVAIATGFDREIGKRINQTLISGGGKKKLAETWGITMDEVTKIWDTYFDRLPEVQTLQRRASKVMEQRGYVKSLLGRRARLVNHNRSYVAINRLLQTGNADILKLKMVEVDEYLRGINNGTCILNNVHDSLDLEFYPDNRQTYDRVLEILVDFGPSSAVPLDVPMAVDSGEGENWADATYNP